MIKELTEYKGPRKIVKLNVFTLIGLQLKHLFLPVIKL